MNLFKKIGVAVVGIAMAIGVGVAVGSKAEVKPVYATDAFSFSRSGSSDTVTEGYEMILTNAKNAETYYQDKSSTVGLDIGVKKSSGTIWTTAPTSISLTVKVGGGSAKNPLTNVVTANLIDSSGTAIANTSVDVTDKVETTTGKDYTVSVPVADNAAGIMIHHVKESSYNVRVYAISLSYEGGSGGGDPDPEPETITVSYDANGGTGTMAASAVDNNGSVTLTANSFTRSKYEFTGWNKAANGSGASYADGATINNITESFTLYAQWSQNEFDVTYDANGGSGTMTKSVTGSQVSACTFVPPTNKVFNGWNTAPDGSGENYAVDDTLSALAADMTLYAQWANRPALSGSETLAYTLYCLKNGSNNSYTNVYDLTQENISWKTQGNQTFGDYWRIGSAKNSSNTSRIYTAETFADASEDDIVKIVLNHNGVDDSKLKVNSIVLQVASDSSFNTLRQEITYTPTFGVSTSGSIEFIPSSNSLWSKSSYYRFTFDITNGNSDKGHGLDITSIQFFYDLVSSDYATGLAASPTSLTPTKGSLITTALSGLTITASVNGAATAAYSHYSAKVIRRDDSFDVIDGSTIFKTGDKKITITALDPTTQGGSTFDSVDITTSVSYTAAVTVGNKYAFVSDGNVFKGLITSNYGASEAYTNTPSEYGFVVEGGLYDGTVSFKLLSGTNANKYISWTGTSAQLAVSDTKTALASWVAFNDSGDDVIANASNENATLRYNANRFAAYIGDNGDNANFLLLGTSKCDTFASMFMKMDSYDVGGKIGDDNGEQLCTSYYAIAKDVYNGEATGENAQYNLSAEERAFIYDSYGLYTATYTRLSEWARINGDSFNNSTHILEVNQGGVVTAETLNSSNSTLIIVVISLLSVASLGGYFLLRRRKEN